MFATLYLSPADIAARWGVHVRTVRRMIAAGKLPAITVGEHLVRVPVAAVEAHEAGAVRGVS